jgi:hypothetical protein
VKVKLKTGVALQVGVAVLTAGEVGWVDVPESLFLQAGKVKARSNIGRNRVLSRMGPLQEKMGSTGISYPREMILATVHQERGRDLGRWMAGKDVPHKDEDDFSPG